VQPPRRLLIVVLVNPTYLTMKQTMLEHLLEGIVENPGGDARWSVLADWLEEHDDPRWAELLRLFAPSNDSVKTPGLCVCPCRQ
jgi:uncharacterized protein (TIGR02996 family)